MHDVMHDKDCEFNTPGGDHNCCCRERELLGVIRAAYRLLKDAPPMACIKARTLLADALAGGANV